MLLRSLWYVFVSYAAVFENSTVGLKNVKRCSRLVKLCFLSLSFAALALTGGFAQLPQAEAAKPTLTHNEVLSLFTERSTPDELARFRQLSSAPDHNSQTQALQLVLFKLTDDEMFRIGVTSLKQSEWAVAWSTDSKADIAAIRKALKPLGISHGGSFGLGRGG